MADSPKRLIVALTGASGTPYAITLLKRLAQRRIEIHGLISSAGGKVLELETGLRVQDIAGYMTVLYAENDFAAPVASGSFLHDGMIIIPCTMGTMGALANGISNNLIHRAADVTLKENRRLVLVARETPLNRVHITNMLRLAEAGATIMPAMPGFYHHPKTIEELVEDFVDRIMDNLGMPEPDAKRWGEKD
ncbi:MAG: UbiX family flavin prenyltransferase [Pseudomonadota bacterium]